VASAVHSNVEINGFFLSSRRAPPRFRRFNQLGPRAHRTVITPSPNWQRIVTTFGRRTPTVCTCRRSDDELEQGNPGAGRRCRVEHELHSANWQSGGADRAERPGAGGDRGRGWRARHQQGPGRR
jgi:hypothetical protein